MLSTGRAPLRRAFHAGPRRRARPGPGRRTGCLAIRRGRGAHPGGRAPHHRAPARACGPEARRAVTRREAPLRDPALRAGGDVQQRIGNRHRPRNPAGPSADRRFSRCGMGQSDRVLGGQPDGPGHTLVGGRGGWIAAVGDRVRGDPLGRHPSTPWGARQVLEGRGAFGRRSGRRSGDVSTAGDQVAGRGPVDGGGGRRRSPGVQHCRDRADLAGRVRAAPPPPRAGVRQHVGAPAIGDRGATAPSRSRPRRARLDDGGTDRGAGARAQPASDRDPQQCAGGRANP